MRESTWRNFSENWTRKWFTKYVGKCDHRTLKRRIPDLDVEEWRGARNESEYNLIAEYLWSGPGFVGGMSGVVYGLAGYVWMLGKYNHASGVFLDRANIQWMLVWLVVCFTGAVGPIANVAHVAGLIIGLIWGRVAASLKSG